MPLIRADCVFPYFTGTPTDVTMNTFHFYTDDWDPPATATLLRQRLTTFYGLVYGAAAARVPYVDWPLAVCKMFDLSEPTPRIPVIQNLALTGAGTATAALPTEVAAVLSWHAAPESGVRYQRLYNRIFIGCAPSAWMAAAAVDAFPTFTTTAIANIRNAAIALRDADTLGLQWKQVSNAGGVTIARPVAGGWVDNSPDTQRRRGVLASSRNTWAPTP